MAIESWEVGSYKISLNFNPNLLDFFYLGFERYSGLD